MSRFLPLPQFFPQGPKTMCVLFSMRVDLIPPAIRLQSIRNQDFQTNFNLLSS